MSTITPERQQLIQDSTVLYNACRRLVPILQQAGYRGSCMASVKAGIVLTIVLISIGAITLCLLFYMPIMYLLNWVLWRPSGWWREKLSGFLKNGDCFVGLNVWAQPWTRPLIREMTQIQETIRPRMAERVTKTFVIPRHKFMKMGKFLVHEEAVAGDFLIEKDIKSLGGLVLFVSHKWRGNEADPANGAYKDIKKYLESDDGFATSFVWFDRTCVPQEDKKLQFLHLQAIPDIIVRVQLIMTNKDGPFEDAYNASIWCQLEAMFSFSDLIYDEADDVNKKVKVSKWNSAESFEAARQPKPRREWTIYDVFDLYAVLPGFIDKVCHKEYAVDFLTNKPKSLLLVGILQVFMKHYEEYSLPV